MMQKNQVRVSIFGTEYVLKADDNPEHIKKIADYLDKRMREVDRGQSAGSSLKIAILAALNITDELFQEKNYRSRVLEQINEDSRKLNRSFEDILQD